MANTVKGARQLIVHKNVLVDGNIVNIPSFIVTNDLENKIALKERNVKIKKVEDNLGEILEHTRGELEEIGIDNPDYDPELAKIGREEVSKDDEDEKSDKKEKSAKKSEKSESENEEEVDDNSKNSRQSTLI